MSRRRKWLRRILGPDEPDREIEALQAQMLELEQRLGVTLRAVQMATKQAAQANQAATSASATAESAIDGVMGVEDQVARLMERLATETAPSTD